VRGGAYVRGGMRGTRAGMASRRNESVVDLSVDRLSNASRGPMPRSKYAISSSIYAISSIAMHPLYHPRVQMIQGYKCERGQLNIKT